MTRTLIILLLLSIFSQAVPRQKKSWENNNKTKEFPYSPIDFNHFVFSEPSQTDWELKENTKIGMKDAVIIHSLAKYEYADDYVQYYTYKKIKILSQAGLDAATQMIVYDTDEISNVEFKGRTILPDGTIYELSEKDVFTDTVKSRGDQEQSGLRSIFAKAENDDYLILRKKIIFPGAQIGAIIEFLTKQKTNYFISGFDFQNEYYTQTSQFIIPKLLFDWHLQNPLNKLLEIEFMPSRQEPEMVVFSMNDMPAFKSEIMMPPSEAFNISLFIFPASYRARYLAAILSNYRYLPRIVIQEERNGLATCTIVPRNFWKDYVQLRDNFWRDFSANSSLVPQVVNSTVDPTDSKSVRMQKLYAYVQEAFRGRKSKTKDKKSKNPENPENIDELIKQKEGPSWMVNGLYALLLRESGIPATTFEFNDRDERIFSEEIIIPKFRRTIVLADTGKHDYIFLSPATRLLPCGMLPWYMQNVTGVVHSYEHDGRPITSRPFLKTPSERNPSSNIHMVAVTLTLNEDFSADMEVQENFKGQQDWIFKVKNYEKSDNDLKKEYEKEFKEKWSDAKLVTFNTANRDSLHASSKVNYSLHLPDFVTPIGDKIYIKPFQFLEEPIRQLPAVEERKYPVWIYFVRKYVISLKIILPVDWHLDYLPNVLNTSSNQATFRAEYHNLEKCVIFTGLLELHAQEIQPHLYENIRSVSDAVHRVFNQELSVSLK